MPKIPVSKANQLFMSTLAEAGATACLTTVLDNSSSKKELRRMLKDTESSEIISYLIRLAREGDAFGELSVGTSARSSVPRAKRVTKTKELPSDEDRCTAYIYNGGKGSSSAPFCCKKVSEEGCDGMCAKHHHAYTRAKETSVEGKMCHHYGNLSYTELMPCEPFVGALPAWLGRRGDNSVLPLYGHNSATRQDCEDFGTDLHKEVKILIERKKVGVWHDPVLDTCNDVEIGLVSLMAPKKAKGRPRKKISTDASSEDNTKTPDLVLNKKPKAPVEPEDSDSDSDSEDDPFGSTTPTTPKGPPPKEDDSDSESESDDEDIEDE